MLEPGENQRQTPPLEEEDLFLNFTQELFSLKLAPFMKYSFYTNNYIFGQNEEEILKTNIFNFEELIFFRTKMQNFGTINPKFRTKKAFIFYTILAIFLITNSIFLFVFKVLTIFAIILLIFGLITLGFGIFGLLNYKKMRNNFLILRKEELLKFLNEVNSNIKNSKKVMFRISRFTSYIELINLKKKHINNLRNSCTRKSIESFNNEMKTEKKSLFEGIISKEKNSPPEFAVKKIDEKTLINFLGTFNSQNYPDEEEKAKNPAEKLIEIEKKKIGKENKNICIDLTLSPEKTVRKFLNKEQEKKFLSDLKKKRFRERLERSKQKKIKIKQQEDSEKKKFRKKPVLKKEDEIDENLDYFNTKNGNLNSQKRLNLMSEKNTERSLRFENISSKNLRFSGKGALMLKSLVE